jgi:hypothetical protein
MIDEDITMQTVLHERHCSTIPHFLGAAKNFPIQVVQTSPHQLLLSCVQKADIFSGVTLKSSSVAVKSSEVLLSSLFLAGCFLRSDN